MSLITVGSSVAREIRYLVVQLLANTIHPTKRFVSAECVPWIEAHCLALGRRVCALKFLILHDDRCYRGKWRNVLVPDHRCVLDRHDFGIALKLHHEREASRCPLQMVGHGAAQMTRIGLIGLVGGYGRARPERVLHCRGRIVAVSVGCGAPIPNIERARRRVSCFEQYPQRLGVTEKIRPPPVVRGCLDEAQKVLWRGGEQSRIAVEQKVLSQGLAASEIRIGDFGDLHRESAKILLAIVLRAGISNSQDGGIGGRFRKHATSELLRQGVGHRECRVEAPQAFRLVETLYETVVFQPLETHLLDQPDHLASHFRLVRLYVLFSQTQVGAVAAARHKQRQYQRKR